MSAKSVRSAAAGGPVGSLEVEARGSHDSQHDQDKPVVKIAKSFDRSRAGEIFGIPASSRKANCRDTIGLSDFETV